MKTLDIKGVKRTEIGKKGTKKVRNEGSVPCVIYGGKENIHFSADVKEFNGLIFSPNTHIAKIAVEGKSYEAIMKEVQYHPVSDEILHIDFLQVAKDKKVTVGIPVELKGFPIGVKDGGKLALELRKLKAKAFPQNLPEVFEVDVEELGLGKTIKVRDLNYEGVELVDFANTVVASVKLTRAAKGAAEVAATGKK